MEITSSQKLALLFPKSNKVLSSILENASPQQLETLSQAKDLKAILTELTIQTLDTTKSNTILLDILKNSDFFKELGSFPKELKILVELLEQSKAPDKTQTNSLEKFIKLLQGSLIDIKQSDVKSLQDFVKNSGVFLESKFLEEPKAKEILKGALYEIKDQLSKSEKSMAPKLLTIVQSLLEHKTLYTKSNNLISLKFVKKELEPLLSSLKDISKSAEPMYSKELKVLSSKLEQLLIPTTKEKGFSLSSFKNIILDISSELRISAQPSTKLLNAQLEPISTKISSILEHSSPIPLLKKLSLALENIRIPQASNIPIQEAKVNSPAVKNIPSTTELLISSNKDIPVNKTLALDSKENTKPIQNKIDLLENKTLDSLKSTRTAETPKLSLKNLVNFEDIKHEVKTLSRMKVEDIEALKPSQFTLFFSSLSEEIRPLNIQSTKGIFETIEKILMVLKQPSQDFMKEKIPKEIKSWIANFDKELEKGDIVFSKSFQTQISKLKNFFAPSQILENKLLQENLQKDLKALLIGLEKEVGSLSTNNATEVLKS
ncbi:hypothetical protein JHD50_06000, partial [Sulfurimonas sp. MAG313]